MVGQRSRSCQGRGGVDDVKTQRMVVQTQPLSPFSPRGEVEQSGGLRTVSLLLGMKGGASRPQVPPRTPMALHHQRTTQLYATLR